MTAIVESRDARRELDELLAALANMEQQRKDLRERKRARGKLLDTRRRELEQLVEEARVEHQNTSEALVFWERKITETRNRVAVLRRAANESAEAQIRARFVACERCGVRPRHFDHLCKRCAEETGQRPHGKIV